jgi:putative Holliday junction resolvase
MRILAVDPGDKHIGLAISDPTGTIANPLTVLKHRARKTDAAEIVQIALKRGVERIIVGQPLDDEGRPTPQARKAARLARTIQSLCDLPVELVDESGSTQAARAARIALGSPRRKRRGHLDDLAATIILQTYLDSRC